MTATKRTVIGLGVNACCAGSTWGFANRWATTEIVRHHPTLR